MNEVVVSLRGGPADGLVVELAVPLSDELEIDVVRRLRFSLVDSVGGSTPLVSAHRRERRERHRYRLAQRDPPVMDWTGRREN